MYIEFFETRRRLASDGSKRHDGAGRQEKKANGETLEKKIMPAYRCKVTVPCAFAVELPTVAAHFEISEHVMGVHGRYVQIVA